jgi:hypothetical protein
MFTRICDWFSASSGRRKGWALGKFSKVGGGVKTVGVESIRQAVAAGHYLSENKVQEASLSALY